MTDDPLADLLLEWEERFDRGEDVPAAALCPDRPDLVPPLEERIAALRRAAWMKRTGSGGEPSGPGAVGESAVLAGRYRLDGLIGAGGFGQVWRGFDLQLRRPVAVKVPLPGRPPAGPGGEDRFLDEARRVARLTHPGIVPVFDVGLHGGTPFIVSQLIDGDDLGRRLRDGPLSVQEAVRVAAEVAGHLAYAHGAGFVHRDVKPANILLDRAGRAFVTDFGIALSEGDPAHDGVGTLAYMSPERLTGSRAGIDARADIYSLGVVLYEMLVGRVPFFADSPAVVRQEVLTRMPLSPRVLDQLVPAEIEAVCFRCLAKDPAERYQSADVLAQVLSRWLVSQRAVPCRVPGSAATRHHDQTPGWSSQPPALLSPADRGEGTTHASADRTSGPGAGVIPPREADPADGSGSWVGQHVVRRHVPEYLTRLGDCGGGAAGVDYFWPPMSVSADTGDAVSILGWHGSYWAPKAELLPARVAAGYFSKLIRREPSCPAHHIRRSWCSWAEGRVEPAMIDAEEAVRLAPTLPWAWVTRGYLFVWLDGPGIGDFDRAVGLDPTSAWVRVARARALTRLNKFDEAASDYSEAVRLDPTWAPVWFERGACRWMRSCRRPSGSAADPTGALDDLAKATRLRPTLALAWKWRGHILCYLHRYEEAIDDLNRAVRLEPTCGATFARRGEAYLALKNVEAAWADVTEAVRLQPSEVQPWLTLARLAIPSGDRPVGHRFESVPDAETTLKAGGDSSPAAHCRIAVARICAGNLSGGARWLAKAMSAPGFPAALAGEADRLVMRLRLESLNRTRRP